MSQHDESALEIWGGIECTVNRVGDRYHRQMVQSGHHQRPDDIGRVASLGIRTLRYPVLWEDVAPDGVEHADWRWTDERLDLLRQHGIRPIVGLLHHGSGPPDTSLITPDFPERFAKYAAAVAARYPWVSDYTPVNEPVTTARFSALYGQWFPHRRDDVSFVRAVLNQCRATVLAMQAIRRVNPEARLIQTEDLGKTFSRRNLAYQARFDNQRRWLGWDLLCGRVGGRHPLRRYLIDSGATQAELDWFRANACPPDIIGINHYVTSSRYLHQEESWCPRERWGGNGIEHYADAEAVRAMTGRAFGIETVLREAWERYAIPLAVTEVHLGCSRDEQLRWLYEVWGVARKCRRQGIDVRAITPWALFGSFDWDSLVTECRQHYEPGAFDVRGPGRPRETALADLIRTMAKSGTDDGIITDRFPGIAAPGWWRRKSRLLRRRSGVPARPPVRRASRRAARPVLITGAAGTLGQAFARMCQVRGLEYIACARGEFDIAEPERMADALDSIKPWAVVNAAGYVKVDQAESECDLCFRENHIGAVALAQECATRGLRLLTFSSDLVFDGTQEIPYLESDTVAPLGVYGLSKAKAESDVLAANPRALVVRTSAFFGPWDAHNFITRALATLREGGRLEAAGDLFVSPTYVPDLANASLDLLQDGESGIWHLANEGVTSWHDFARQVAQATAVPTSMLQAVSANELAYVAARPRYSVLGSERGRVMPALEDAIGRYASTLLAG